MANVRVLAENAKQAAAQLALLSETEKNQILFAMAEELENHIPFLLKENETDLRAAREKGTSDAMLDRLRLSEDRIFGMANGLRKVAALPDPIGQIIEGGLRPNGLRILKRRVPIGVVGIIYEARPNVTADAIGLCLKTGNAALLRGGSEAICSNLAISKLCQAAGEKAGMPAGSIGFLSDTSRESAKEMMRLNGLVDVLIPRGGAGLIQSVVQNATVPTIETGTGNCHVYVDAAADLSMAKEIIVNAKTSRPSVCNAAETLLVHQEIAETFLPMVFAALHEKNVQIRGCEIALQYGADQLATEEDYAKEFLDYILAVKVVANVQEAAAHINRYGTGHSECIVTSTLAPAEYFKTHVDAAAVYVNASTRFTDGEEFGFGAEIGISTQKLHARGPMGLLALTTCQYWIEGNGQVR